MSVLKKISVDQKCEKKIHQITKKLKNNLKIMSVLKKLQLIKNAKENTF